MGIKLMLLKKALLLDSITLSYLKVSVLEQLSVHHILFIMRNILP